MNNDYRVFPVTVFGEEQKFSDTLTKQRCRIFYRGANRNGSFITDEFADELIKTLPYAPVKGIYDAVNEDYTDHGQERTEGRIYGIVPSEKDMNFAWEKHLDSDGVEREYACADVYLYTAIYKEAGKIAGKAQSMELYDKTIDGEWKIYNGMPYFYFTKGSFLGLQALGDDTEPCFEGAAFFSLYNSLKDMVSKIETYQKKLDQGETKMNTNFKISDDEKYQYLWTLLNDRFNDEGGWMMDYSICSVYDEYAIAFAHRENKYYRVFYTKNDEDDSLAITSKEECFIIDVNEAEKNALKKLHDDNSNTYELLDEKFENLTKENAESGTKITELTETYSTLKIENEKAQEDLVAANAKIEEVTKQFTEATQRIDELNASFAEATASIEAYSAQVAELSEYKHNIELTEKNGVIAGYADSLDDSILAQYKENIDQYTAVELDMKLTYEMKKANPSMFEKQPVPQYIPTPQPEVNEWTALSEKYKK